MDIKTASEWLKAIKEKYIHGGDESYDEQRKEAIDFAIKTMNDQQHQIWELQDLVEFYEDRQRKIRMIVQPNGEIQPLDRIPMKPIRGGSGDGSKVWHLCGRCNSCVDTNTVRYNYCQFCGTKVDWDSVT